MQGVKLNANLWRFEALMIKVFKQYILLMDISQERDPKSQNKVLVLSSYGKNLEWHVRERYFKSIGVYKSGWRISSHTDIPLYRASSSPQNVFLL